MGLGSLQDEGRATPCSDISSKSSLPGFPRLLPQASSKGHLVAWPPGLSASKVKQQGLSLLSQRDQKRLSGIKGSGRSVASLPTSHPSLSRPRPSPLPFSAARPGRLHRVRTCWARDPGSETLSKSCPLVTGTLGF